MFAILELFNRLFDCSRVQISASGLHYDTDKANAIQININALTLTTSPLVTLVG